MFFELLGEQSLRELAAGLVRAKDVSSALGGGPD